ncbi:Gibberellin 3-beta-dioxygenase 1 [Panicum miliaceum]|uniref:Gibberellin 3-beta-dioxygenase 1 n=1 Tax=Panicum miliaceum TaxID=4540 RepID=A0A3L6SE38_PANMI|nr:Gibberellin 3-beta-dioxygenase 1 [Panicum miliaceum]
MDGGRRAAARRPAAGVPRHVAFYLLAMHNLARWLRVPACIHRVKTVSNRERFSVLFTAVAKNGAVLSSMDEFVDWDHPLMYNPLKTDEYVVFRYSEEGFKVSNPLEEFCGVHKSGSSME